MTFPGSPISALDITLDHVDTDISLEPARSLYDFPVEILENIAEHMRADTFVNFSQTCRLFRAIAPIERQHLLQRLLVLETIPSVAGAVPEFEPENNRISPSWQDVEAWDQVRYACAGCLRLRHHRFFDNHSILRLTMQKPHAGSPAAEIPAEPGNAKQRGKLRRERNGKESVDRAKLVHRKNFAGAKDAERYIRGCDRARRFCLDCQFERGVFNRRTSTNKGTAQMPIITTRPKIQTQWNRGRRQAPRSAKQLLAEVNRDLPRMVAHPDNMIRCTCCGTWQNLENYLQALLYRHDLDYFRALRKGRTNLVCNSCDYKRSGAEKATERLRNCRGSILNRELKHIAEGMKLMHRRIRFCLNYLDPDSDQDEDFDYDQMAAALNMYQSSLTVMEERKKHLEDDLKAIEDDDDGQTMGYAEMIISQRMQARHKLPSPKSLKAYGERGWFGSSKRKHSHPSSQLQKPQVWELGEDVSP